MGGRLYYAEPEIKILGRLRGCATLTWPRAMTRTPGDSGPALHQRHLARPSVHGWAPRKPIVPHARGTGFVRGVVRMQGAQADPGRRAVFLDVIGKGRVPRRGKPNVACRAPAKNQGWAYRRRIRRRWGRREGGGSVGRRRSADYDGPLGGTRWPAGGPWQTGGGRRQHNLKGAAVVVVVGGAGELWGSRPGLYTGDGVMGNPKKCTKSRWNARPVLRGQTMRLRIVREGPPAAAGRVHAPPARRRGPHHSGGPANRRRRRRQPR